MKIKILYVNGGIMNRGGIESYMMNYFRHIDKECFQIDFIVHGYQEGVFDAEIENAGSRIYRLPVKSKEPLRYNALLKKVLSENRYDIIHSHVDAMSCWILKVAKECGVPVRIAHSHNTNHLTTNKLKYVINEYARKKITKYATHCFACSKVAGEWLFGEHPFDVIRNAIGLDQFVFSVDTRQKIRTELGIAEDDFVIGHVGRFDDQKNHRFLVDVFNVVYQKNPRAKLLLIGAGKLKEEIEEKVRTHGIADRVLFLGSQQEVCKFYNIMDLFVFPSLFEGLGIVLIEAQANGLVSLASEMVPPEVNHDDAVTFVPLERELWAEQILISMKKTNDRHNEYMEELRRDGYDIVKAVQKLENKYWELVKE